MSVIQDVLQRCADLLIPLTNQAKLYPYTPYGNSEAALKAIMLDPTNRIHMWSVIRESTKAEDKSIPAIYDYHTVVFRGWYSLRDDGSASGIEFTEEIESIRSSFWNNRELRKADGSDPKAYRCNPMQVRMQMTGSFAGYLVHYAEITMRADIYPIDFVNRP